MTRAPRASALALAAASAAVLLSASGVSAGTIRIGRGIDAWRLGQKLELAPGLVRFERHRENDRYGCDLGPRTASRIDYYPGLRLSWRGLGSPASLYLMDVATTRAGDRSATGFVIGQSRLAQVRARHPSARLSRPGHRDRYALGTAALTLTRATGDETWDDLTYWFDAAGKLVAIQAGAGGC